MFGARAMRRAGRYVALFIVVTMVAMILASALLVGASPTR
jgi:hypothetical protein